MNRALRLRPNRNSGVGSSTKPRAEIIAQPDNSLFLFVCFMMRGECGIIMNRGVGCRPSLIGTSSTDVSLQIEFYITKFEIKP